MGCKVRCLWWMNFLMLVWFAGQLEEQVLYRFSGKYLVPWQNVSVHHCRIYINTLQKSVFLINETKSKRFKHTQTIKNKGSSNNQIISRVSVKNMDSYTWRMNMKSKQQRLISSWNSLTSSAYAGKNANGN